MSAVVETLGSGTLAERGLREKDRACALTFSYVFVRHLLSSSLVTSSSASLPRRQVVLDRLRASGRQRSLGLSLG